MAPEDMETEGPSDEADDSSPPEGDSARPGGDSAQRARLWDGRGRFEDAPLETGPGSSGRARIDLDYSRGELI